MPSVSISAFGPKPAWFDASGNPTVGYKLFMYVAGSTSTKQNSYTNSTGAVANTNPIILNSLGQTPNELWWDSSLIYKAVLAPSTDTDPPTNPVWTIDNLTGMNSGSTAVAGNEWIIYSASTPAFVSANSFTVTGNQTATFQIGRRLQFMTTAGFVYGRITNSVFSALTTVTIQMDGTQVLNSSLSAVYYSILTSNVLALPERIASTTGTNTYTATVGILNLVIGDVYKINIQNVNTIAATPTLALEVGGAIAILQQDGSVVPAGGLNGQHQFYYNGTNYIVLNPNTGGNYSSRSSVAVATVFTASYAGQAITSNSASPLTHTLPLANTFLIGKTISFYNAGAGIVSITRQGSDLLTAANIIGGTVIPLNQGESITLVSTGIANGWILSSANVTFFGTPIAWQNVTGSRTFGTTFTNSSGRGIKISGYCANNSDVTLQVIVSGLEIWRIFASASQVPTIPFYFDVPNNAPYSINVIGGAATLSLWNEER